MANRFNIEMLGAPALSQALADLPDAMERKVITKAMREAGKYFLTLAKAQAPVSEDPRDTHRGKLKSTMKLKAMKRRRGRVGVLVQTGTRAELGIDPKDPGYYPAHVEFGTKDTAPRAYMRTSLSSAREAMFAVLRQEIDTGIERELLKAGSGPGGTP